MAKKIDKPQHMCWDCVYARPNEDPRYRTPDNQPIFYLCYLNPNKVKRGLMDNTKACSQFKYKLL